MKHRIELTPEQVSMALLEYVSKPMADGTRLRLLSATVHRGGGCTIDVSIESPDQASPEP